MGADASITRVSAHQPASSSCPAGAGPRGSPLQDSPRRHLNALWSRPIVPPIASRPRRVDQAAVDRSSHSPGCPSAPEVYQIIADEAKPLPRVLVLAPRVDTICVQGPPVPSDRTVRTFLRPHPHARTSTPSPLARSSPSADVRAVPSRPSLPSCPPSMPPLPAAIGEARAGTRRRAAGGGRGS